MSIIGSLSAKKTDLARNLEARGLAEGITLGDWSFQVGSYGFNPALPDEVFDVDASQQALTTPLGGARHLGSVIAAGGAATAVQSPGYLTVTGLASIPVLTANRFLRLYGSADPTINGMWPISSWVSASSVVVANPLADAGDTGLSWELREFVYWRPNDKAVSFYGRVPSQDAPTDEQELGEVGIFCRVIRAPTEPGLLGQTILYGKAHHVARAKATEMAIGYHVAVQE